MPGLPFDRVSSSSYFKCCTSLIADASSTLLMRIVSNNVRQQIHLTIMPRQTHIKHKFVSNRPRCQKRNKRSNRKLGSSSLFLSTQKTNGNYWRHKEEDKYLEAENPNFGHISTLSFLYKIFLNSRILLNR